MSGILVDVSNGAYEQPYRQYTQSLLRNTQYRATWQPGEAMELGAVGVLADGLFDQRARLADFGIEYQVKPARGATSFEYQSSKGVTSKYKAAGEASDPYSALAKAHAGVRFEFSRSGAVIFSAPNCTVNEIDNKRSLEARLRRVLEWDLSWVVVSKTLQAESATILVSGSDNSWAELRAQAQLGLDSTELADLAVGFTRARTSGMAVQLVAEGGVTPLYEVHRMKGPRFNHDPMKRKLEKV